jgi:hypothetical protein
MILEQPFCVPFEKPSVKVTCKIINFALNFEKLALGENDNIQLIILERYFSPLK